MDIDKPLRRCLRVDVLGDGKETVLILRYERLLNHCFQCAYLGHQKQECLEAKKVNESAREALPYGAWLRATGPEKRYMNWGWRKDSKPGGPS